MQYMISKLMLKGENGEIQINAILKDEDNWIYLFFLIKVIEVYYIQAPFLLSTQKC